MDAHILVIEDDESILNLFRVFLEKDGFVVSTARNACQNVRDIEAIAPDLIILDIMFGLHHDGFRLLQKLRMYPPTEPIPIIICTAAVSAIREQEDILQQKGIPLLYKPFRLRELHQAIETLLPSLSKGKTTELEASTENSHQQRESD